MLKNSFLLLLLLWAVPSIAQLTVNHDHERCGFVHANNWDNPETQAKHQAFEQALHTKILENRQLATARTTNEDTIWQIPVIVHVVHNGEAVGTGANITQAQVYSQIQALNDDFRGTNFDRDNVREPFKDLRGDTKVEFVLATEDEDGNVLTEPGIHRYNGNKSEWGGLDDFDQNAKPLTSWDPTRYVNFWTADLPDWLLGYAQWPKNSAQTGVPNINSDPDSYDGVVMNYPYFGSSQYYAPLTTSAPFDLGRTTTHELGHWLGLLHISGDGGCTVDDFVDDTPTQSFQKLGCPSATDSTCSTLDQWENFMDYTDDACMSMFSKEQVERMRAVIEIAPMRDALVHSDVETMSAYLNLATTANGCGTYTIDATFAGADSYEWTLSGNSTVLGNDPMLTVTTSGEYVMTATSFGNTQQDTIEVNILGSAVANFSYRVSNTGLTVTFTNTSTDAIDGFEWDFGDGNTSTEENPVHTYADFGSYTATLIAKSSCGNGTISKPLPEVTSLGTITRLAQQMLIYPNPNEGNFVLDVPSIQATTAYIELVDITGRKLWSKQLNNLAKENISLPTMEAGIYFIRLEVNGEVGIKKIQIR